MIIEVIDYSETTEENDRPKVTRYSAESYREVAGLVNVPADQIAKDISTARTKGSPTVAYLTGTPWGTMKRSSSD